MLLAAPALHAQLWQREAWKKALQNSQKVRGPGLHFKTAITDVGAG
jgi:hypothetical protein